MVEYNDKLRKMYGKNYYGISYNCTMPGDINEKLDNRLEEICNTYSVGCYFKKGVRYVVIYPDIMVEEFSKEVDESIWYDKFVEGFNKLANKLKPVVEEFKDYIDNIYVCPSVMDKNCKNLVLMNGSEQYGLLSGLKQFDESKA